MSARKQIYQNLQNQVAVRKKDFLSVISKFGIAECPQCLCDAEDAPAIWIM